MSQIIIGEIIREHGLSGEVSVRLYNPSSQVLELGFEVEITGSKIVQSVIKKIRPGPKGLLVQFGHLSSPEQAKEWRGAKIAIDKKYVKLEPKEHLVEDLKGFELESTKGEFLGTVAGFFAQGPSEWFVVKTPSGQEELLPLTFEWIRRIDSDIKKIILELPEGLTWNSTS